VLGKTLRRQLPRGREHRERDRQIESRALLPKRRRREVDGDAPVQRPLERGRDDAASHAVLRLLAGTVGEPDDGEPRHARLKVRLDLHASRLEADERVGDCPGEHSTHGRHRGAPKGNAPVPNELRKSYGV
jgi:hypothetical protein